MEAPTTPGTNPLAGPHRRPPERRGRRSAKLSIEKYADGQITCLKFLGTIDEQLQPASGRVDDQGAS